MKDVAAEEAMMASVWLSDDGAMLDRLEERDFVDPFCLWLFQVLRDTREAGEPLDMLAVMRRVRRPEVLNRLPAIMRKGVASEIARVLTASCTSAHLAYYLRVLRTERLRRAVATLSDSIRERVESHQEPVEILTFIERNVDLLLSHAKRVD